MRRPAAWRWIGLLMTALAIPGLVVDRARVPAWGAIPIDRATEDESSPCPEDGEGDEAPVESSAGSGALACSPKIPEGRIRRVARPAPVAVLGRPLIARACVRPASPAAPADLPVRLCRLTC